MCSTELSLFLNGVVQILFSWKGCIDIAIEIRKIQNISFVTVVNVS
jgi:hypothetical protein